MIKIVLNGEQKELEEGMNVAKLLQELEISVPCAVEQNKKVVPKALHPETIINDGDTIEVVTIVGGG